MSGQKKTLKSDLAVKYFKQILHFAFVGYTCMRNAVADCHDQVTGTFTLDNICVHDVEM